MEVVDSDIDSSSTISFRNEEMIKEFILNPTENPIDKWENNVNEDSEMIDSGIKINTYFSDEEKNKQIAENEEDDDGEVRYLSRRNDPSFMTARQRSLLDKKIYGEVEEPVTIPDTMLNNKPSNNTNDVNDDVRRMKLINQSEQRRLIKERQEAEQQATIERLLRISTNNNNTNSEVSSTNHHQVSSTTSNAQEKPSQPIIKVDCQSSLTTVTYIPAQLCPTRQIQSTKIPKLVTCSAHGCNEPRSYACLSTGQPLCHRIQCYRDHISQFGSATTTSSSL